MPVGYFSSCTLGEAVAKQRQTGVANDKSLNERLDFSGTEEDPLKGDR